MKLILINSSVVVLASQHNPSILHPAFLIAQKIVPADWQVDPPPICTPAVSVVKYQNGIDFTVEPTKFQVLDNRPPMDTKESLLPALAASYVRRLPYVRYKAVGINFTPMIECDDPEAQLLDAFVKDGPWKSGRRSPGGASVKLVYELRDARLTFGIDAGVAKLPGREAACRGFLLSANYHSTSEQEESLRTILKYIRKYVSRWRHFAQLCETVGKLEE